MDLEHKITKEEGFFKRFTKCIRKAGIYCGLVALALLPSCVQYRARVMTKPPEEINIYLDEELKGKTSKKEPVYVESPRQLQYPCKISLKANNYDAYFWMRFKKDIVENKSKETVITLDPKGRSEYCLSAKVTRWEKGPSYDLVFEIPKNLLANLHKPKKKYTEWGDEIKEEEPEKPGKKPLPTKPYEKKESYEKPEIKEPIKKPKETLPTKKPEISTDIGQLVDEKKSIEFCASIGVGSAYGGIDAIGVSAGIEFNLGKATAWNRNIGRSLELFASAGYLLLTKDTWLNKFGAEAGATLHFKYYQGWSFYLKFFGGTQGKDVEWTSLTKGPEEVTLYGLGLFAGHRFVIKDNFFIFLESGPMYLLDVPEWQRYSYGCDIGVGVKF